MASGERKSELDKCVDRAYLQLEQGIYKTKHSSSAFRCPFCLEKKGVDYRYEEVMEHASRRGEGSKSMALKLQGQHVALADYLVKYHSNQEKRIKVPLGSDSVAVPVSPIEKGEVRSKGGREDTMLEQDKSKKYVPPLKGAVLVAPAAPVAPIGKGEVRSICGKEDTMLEQDKSKKYVDPWKGAVPVAPAAPVAPIDKGEVRGRRGREDTMLEQDKSKKYVDPWKGAVPAAPVAPIDKGEVRGRCGREDTMLEHDKSKKYVHPWKGVLKNVPREYVNGRYSGKSGTDTKAQLAEQGIMAKSVIPIWSFKGHSGCSVVTFSADWNGFAHAMKFEKAFELDRHGKTDWNIPRSSGPGDKLYGWVATEQDFYSNDSVGDHLRKFNLKSVHELEVETERKAAELVQNLSSTVENKNLELKRMVNKLEEMSDSARNVMDESDAMVETHNKEMSKMHLKQREEMKMMLIEHERIKKKLESQKKKLKLQQKEMEMREFQNENEQKEISRQQRMNEIAHEVQTQAQSNMLRLAEEQKNEKEALHNKILILEEELNRKQALELELERMRGAVNVLKHMGDDDDDGDKEAEQKKNSIEKEIEDIEEELEDIEETNQALIIKEHRASEEIQEALAALITGLQKGATKGARPNIGVKVVGQLDGKAFEVAAKRLYPAKEAIEKATEWWCLYESYVRDISWCPFKHGSEEGTNKEVIDEEDVKLQKLKNELGEEPYNAVVTALTELNRYSPEDRTPRTELWNFKSQQKSDLYEGATYLVNKWKTQSRK